MLINISRLKNLPVVTLSGKQLGRVIDLELEIETQTVMNLLVRHHVLGKVLVINRSQIKSITAEAITVDDSSVTVTEETLPEKQYEPSVGFY